MIRAFTTCDGQGINPALLGPEHRASRIQNRWGWRNNSCESECQERSYQCGFNGRVKWFPYYQYAELRGAAVHVHLLTGTNPQGLKVAGRGESTHTAPRQYRTPSRLKLFRSLCQQNWHELLKGEIGRQKLQLLYSSHPFPLPPAPWQTIKRLGGNARLRARDTAFELQAGGAISPPWLRAFHLHRTDPFISLILKWWKRRLFGGVCWVDDFPKPMRFVWVSKLALIQQAEMAILSAPYSEQRQSSDVKSFSKSNSSLAFLFPSKFLVWFALHYSLQVFAVRPVYYHILHIHPCSPWSFHPQVIIIEPGKNNCFVFWSLLETWISSLPLHKLTHLKLWFFIRSFQSSVSSGGVPAAEGLLWASDRVRILTPALLVPQAWLYCAV